MKILYIIRGLSGAGKTTLAYSISPNVVEADQYFVKTVNGKTVYEWEGSKLPAAHRWCHDQVKGLMEMGEDKIAVANTFTRQREFEEYIELAEEYGYEYHVITVENYHGNESVHDIPEYVLERQENRYDIRLWNKTVKVNQ